MTHAVKDADQEKAKVSPPQPRVRCCSQLGRMPASAAPKKAARGDAYEGGVGQ